MDLNNFLKLNYNLMQTIVVIEIGKHNSHAFRSINVNVFQASSFVGELMRHRFFLVNFD
jgi:hypothetical protein